MKTSRLPLLLCALLAAGSSFAEDAKDTKDIDSPDTLIATVNGTPYPLDVFRMFYLERIQQHHGREYPSLSAAGIR